MATITDTWDATFQGLPNNARSADYLASDISTPKRAVSERGRREHYWTPGSDNSKHGLHLPGSAVAFVQDAAPTTRPDGDTLDDDDIGRLWFDSDDSNIPYLRLTGAWQQIGGGMTGTIYILGSGSADRSIQFAGDATLLWDESEDRFIPSKIVGGARYGGSFVDASNPTQNDVFDALSPYIPVVGDNMLLSGGLGQNGTTDVVCVARMANRYSETVVRLYVIEFNFTAAAPAAQCVQSYITCTDGSSSVLTSPSANTLEFIAVSW